MTNFFEQIRWKMHRAHECSELLNGIAKNFLESKFCTLRTDIDRKHRLVLRFGEVKPFPPMYSVVVGEFAHHLRGVLDYLAFAVSRPKNSNEEQKICFPLCSTKAQFDSGKATKLAGADKAVVKFIESVQPYHSRKWPDAKYLGYLREISNKDKHRALSICAVAIENSTIRYQAQGSAIFLREESFRGRVKSNKIISRVIAVPDAVGTIISPHPSFEFRPVFDKSMSIGHGYIPVASTLGSAYNFILAEIIPQFERFITAR